MLIDISPSISANTAIWPGDVPFSRSVLCSINDGANIDLSSINSTLHIGSHADAPSHYKKDAKTIDEVILDPYLGECQVIKLENTGDRLIRVEEVLGKITAPRVLFYTGSFPNPNSFNEDFRAFSKEAIEYMHSEGVKLIGIDTPSFDLFESKTLEAHSKLAQFGIANLEGLILDDVKEGHYELIALPLKIEKADASPVRAILRSLNEI